MDVLEALAELVRHRRALPRVRNRIISRVIEQLDDYALKVPKTSDPNRNKWGEFWIVFDKFKFNLEEITPSAQRRLARDFALLRYLDQLRKLHSQFYTGTRRSPPTIDKQAVRIFSKRLVDSDNKREFLKLITRMYSL